MITAICLRPRSQKATGIRSSDALELMGDASTIIDDVTCPDAGDSIPSVAWGEIKTQLALSRRVVSMPAGTIVWKGRASSILLPLVTAKLRRKRSIVLLESRGSSLVGGVYGGKSAGLLAWVYRRAENWACALADKLVVNVPGLLRSEWLAGYGEKVFHEAVAMRFVSPVFTMMKPVSERQRIVGYVGRLSMEKGILNLLSAMPAVREECHARFWLCGDGPLASRVRTNLPQGSVAFGWVAHNQLPTYLNDMKLLVVPSYYEGLPTVVLEAMSCGTPVLGNAVGALPDLITEGETGFLMNGNSPACIADNIMRAMKSPLLEQVSHKAKRFVDAEYSWHPMKAKWQALLEET